MVDWWKFRRLRCSACWQQGSKEASTMCCGAEWADEERGLVEETREDVERR